MPPRSTRRFRARSHRSNHQLNVESRRDDAFAPEDVLKERVREVLEAAAGRPGHIFNLGHGIVPGTPVESVIRVVEWVKELSAR